MTVSAFVIAGTHSGCGKTTVSLGIMAALARRGLTVQPFKVGPDFIDPGHHTLITGRPSHNLDGWMMDRACNRNIFNRYAVDADVAVVEGVMGLFDGFSGSDESGSTAQMAKGLHLPVVLVINAASMARSAAAIALGFGAFDPRLSLAGVILNRVGSPGHAEIL
ncbi:MAG: AAA family ATPase, partial [Deltaproteobacteria bacterium]|nr:AAA family ATPase [Deltaproteobacteria bacterium]